MVTTLEWQQIMLFNKHVLCYVVISTTNLRFNLTLWSVLHKFRPLYCKTNGGLGGRSWWNAWLKYSDLATEAVQHDWKTQVPLTEVDCGGFVTTLTIRLLQGAKVWGHDLWQAARSLPEVAEQSSSSWLWMKQKNSNWSTRRPLARVRGKTLEWAYEFTDPTEAFTPPPYTFR